MINEVERSGQQLYIIVDEYDNFANQLMLSIDTAKEDAGLSQNTNLITEEESLLKIFGGALKKGTQGPIKRLFFTGISPMAFCDASSGLNMVCDISDDPTFWNITGFRESDLEDALRRIDCKQIDYHLERMKCHFNGYRFHIDQKEGVYNPQACLYYLRSLVNTNKEPNPILDENISNSSDSFLQFLVRHRFSKLVIENELETTFKEFIFGYLPPVVLKSNIRRSDLFLKYEISSTLLSLTFHHGYLTYADPSNKDNNNNRGKLVCPNLEFRRILLEAFWKSRDPQNLCPIINEIILAEEKQNYERRDLYFQKGLDLERKTFFQMLIEKLSLLIK